MFAGLYLGVMVALPNERPVALTAIGLCTIIAGVWMVVAALAVLLFSSPTTIGEPGFPGLPAAALAFVVRYSYYGAQVQLIGGGLLVWTGRSLLAQRRWAARVVMVAAVLGLCYLIFFTAVFVGQAWSIPEGTLLLAGVRGFFVAAGLVIGLVWAIPFVLTLHQLRSRRVREALR